MFEKLVLETGDHELNECLKPNSDVTDHPGGMELGDNYLILSDDTDATNRFTMNLLRQIFDHNVIYGRMLAVDMVYPRTSNVNELFNDVNGFDFPPVNELDTLNEMINNATGLDQPAEGIECIGPYPILSNVRSRLRPGSLFLRHMSATLDNPKNNDMEKCIQKFTDTIRFVTPSIMFISDLSTIDSLTKDDVVNFFKEVVQCCNENNVLLIYSYSGRINNRLIETFNNVLTIEETMFVGNMLDEVEITSTKLKRGNPFTITRKVPPGMKYYKDTNGVSARPYTVL